MKRVLLIGIILIGLSLSIWQIWSAKRNGLDTILQQTVKVFEQDKDEQPISSNPLAIENLRSRNYEGSQVTIKKTVSNNASFTTYRISYFSDGLKIFAAMNVPVGEEPFPVILLNHGYYNPSVFKTGKGTQTMADILARNGYLTLASDYRGHGESDSDGISRGHRAEYSTDVLNLMASIKNIGQADPTRVGIWGHSMGGEVSLKVLEITDQVKAAVLWAPTSGNTEKNYNRWAGRRIDADNAQHQNRRLPEPLDPQTLRETSSANYLSYITTPIQLHHGTVDSEVPYDWSVELDKNLRDANKEVEFFTYEGQDHNFKNLGWSEISPRTVEFFNNYLK